MTDKEKELEEAIEEEAKEEGTEECSGETVEEKDELQEANDKYMRLAAEYQNFRKRTETEKQSIATYANERIAKDLLNVVDSFERAISVESADEGFKNGVVLIYKQLMTVLGNFGVEAIESEGKEFDPNFHHAVLSEEAEGVEAGMVLMEMQKGYLLRDRVIRPAMVKVSV